MSAAKLTRLEHAVLRNVWRGLMPWDGRTEAGRVATFHGSRCALARLRRYGFVRPDWYALTPAGNLLIGAVKP